jgi:tryptophanase
VGTRRFFYVLNILCFYLYFITLQLENLKNLNMELPFAESFKIKSVENIHKSTREEREKWIKEAKYNLFALKSDYVFIDLLTDSGTGAMSDRQWAALMQADESYAGARSYYHLKESIEEITGFKYFLPTHQGRAAENVLYSSIIKAGDILPGNSHFDTTKGHIEFRHATAVDCTVDEAKDTQLELPFKGNMDLGKLEDALKAHPADQIPAVVLTVTNNTAGGQPVSMENIKGVSALCRKYGVKLQIDSARFAENCYFIKTREKGYENKSIREIAREMFSYADYMTMSSKKDAIVNMGGFIGFRNEEDWKKAQMYNIMFEGYITYGGMSGRDMECLAVGLKEGTEFEYLETRIRQVKHLADKLDEYGLPYQRPAGGHAVFVDALKFLPNVPRAEFVAQTLACELYKEGGVRGVEIGALLADRDPVTHEERFPALELCRLAIPRRVYTDNHMDYIAAALKNVYDRRDEIKHGLRITYQAPIMRHFTIEMEPVR